MNDAPKPPLVVSPQQNIFLTAQSQKPKPPKSVNYPCLLVVGASGTGKTRSIANLPKDRTKIINVERKLLPFRDAVDFNQDEPDDIFHTLSLVKEAIANPNYDYVVLDSFTKLWEILLRKSQDLHKGYEIYTYFNDQIGMFLDSLKRCGSKFIILLSIDELVEEMLPTGLKRNSRRCAITGKKWEGRVEKEFSIVLFTEVKRSLADKTSTYTFSTNNDGTTSAKSPEGMFEPNISNDLKYVCDTMMSYYKLPKKVTNEPPTTSTSQS